MGTYKEAFVELIEGYKKRGLLEYKFFDFDTKSYRDNAQSRICHVQITNEGVYNKDAVLMVFTIGENVGRTVIQSEGANTNNPSSTYPQKKEAIQQAYKNKWKYLAIAICSKDYSLNRTIKDYVVSIESTDYAKATICVLDDCIEFLEENNNPDFYRCTQVVGKTTYTLSFIKKDKFLDYIRVYDNHFEVEKYANENLNLTSPEKQKERFKNWMSSQKQEDGKQYSETTINSYAQQMSLGYNKFKPYSDYKSIFEIQNEREFYEYWDYLSNAPGFDDYNAKGNRSCSSGMKKYGQFLLESNHDRSELIYYTSIEKSESRNLIFFGAPGTGKSFVLDEKREALIGKNNDDDFERVTFHPDYSYAHFVGTYKPVPYTNEENKKDVTYEYVPGPFMRVLVKALRNGRTDNVKPFLLIIEEINRANVAAVFGDVFQLLDRDDSNVSMYPVQASEDIKKYLAKELGGKPEDYSKIRIPNNMFIWATMNSADQGVFPMDTAFKRRWDFKYLGIDDNDQKIRGKYVKLGKGNNEKDIEWNSLRKAINKYLKDKRINEDKQLGPYFLSKSIVVPSEGDIIDSKEFIDSFKNKVIMYLFEDAAKQKPEIFNGCGSGIHSYSEICSKFDEIGMYIFHSDIVDKITIRKDENNSAVPGESES